MKFLRGVHHDSIWMPGKSKAKEYCCTLHSDWRSRNFELLHDPVDKAMELDYLFELVMWKYIHIYIHIMILFLVGDIIFLLGSFDAVGVVIVRSVASMSKSVAIETSVLGFVFQFWTHSHCLLQSNSSPTSTWDIPGVNRWVHRRTWNLYQDHRQKLIRSRGELITVMKRASEITVSMHEHFMWKSVWKARTGCHCCIWHEGMHKDRPKEHIPRVASIV